MQCTLGACPYPYDYGGPMKAEPARNPVPTCSVVIAAHDAVPTIAQTIESVLAQTMSDFEVMVVDDGSGDDTVARVEDYLSDPRVRLHSQENAGPGPARNKAIELTCGRYVSMLDSDDLWLPDYLERMVDALEQAPDAGFAFTRAWILEREANRIWKTPWSDRVPVGAGGDAASFLPALVNANFVFNSVTIRRAVLELVGSYDPALGQAEDYDLWLRVVTAGHAPVYVPGPLVVCSERADSFSKDGRAMLVGLRGAYGKLADGSAPSPEVATLAEARLRAVERELELLARERARPPWLLIRDGLARATFSWRRRHKRRRTPPAEVAAAFPELGCGRRAVSGAAGRLGSPT
jgi:GT2 family glycosyltransferase